MATLKEQMAIFAKETRVTDEFVDQVRDVLERCGLSMSDDATPYLTQLQDTFRGEAAIQEASRASARNVENLNKRLEDITRNHTRNIGELTNVANSLRRSVARLRSVSAPTNRRRLILCPGPNEMQ